MKTKKWKLKKILKTIWILAGLLFTIWLFYSYESDGVDKSFLQTNNLVKVKGTSDYYLFEPKKEFKNVVIFYPGAMVEAEAYVPLCRRLADKNIKVYLIKMPWRLASKGYNKPKDLHLFEDTSKNYILAGHSQGGKMAAQFVYENPKLIDKLILIGTSHPRDISLAAIEIPVLKIYGSKDGVADEGSILENKSKLPQGTKFQRIEGANHCQFGYYGFQLGDDKADISREQQQKETLDAMVSFIQE
ncbi:alpha/beta hydrolase [Flavobacterium quisquiliarum]|uniref:Alpha/beta hydrolase n=1 Tax=Flavobacterium quisquiliarum TaxID=1834436 RepID=A0ABV8WBH0_9FLAO|nr:alpha/beta hydrolase [Flavobacterium quisquiliarum]MBW1658201.1 alpha/beta hydrolase [Flavobacterium quisquiliarum]NWL02271.1 alpha/beta hydrolase [Flavobacterium collinsii]